MVQLCLVRFHGFLIIHLPRHSPVRQVVHRHVTHAGHARVHAGHIQLIHDDAQSRGIISQRAFGQAM